MPTTKFCLCFGHLIFLLSSIETVQIGLIANVSLFGGPPTQIIPNETCNKCICGMVMSSFASINCFSANKTCQVFANYSLSMNYTLLPISNAAFYFRMLPQIETTTRGCGFFDILNFWEGFLFSIVTTILPTTTHESSSTIGMYCALNYKHLSLFKRHMILHIQGILILNRYDRHDIASYFHINISSFGSRL